MNKFTRRALLATSAAAALPQLRAQRQPNIILIIADDLGYADLGCYGNRTIHMPTGWRPRACVSPALCTQMDDCIGEVMGRVRQYGLDENTLVVFISDNGGDAAANNGRLRGRKAQLFEGGLRVPMIARWPGQIPRNRVNDEFATTMEFFPTFLAAAGASPPAGVKLDGFNLLPAIGGRGHSPRKECFYQDKEAKAARVGQWKWVESKNGGGLFNLAEDPGEQHDLSPEKPVVG